MEPHTHTHAHTHTHHKHAADQVDLLTLNVSLALIIIFPESSAAWESDSQGSPGPEGWKRLEAAGGNPSVVRESDSLYEFSSVHSLIHFLFKLPPVHQRLMGNGVSEGGKTVQVLNWRHSVAEDVSQTNTATTKNI